MVHTNILNFGCNVKCGLLWVLMEAASQLLSEILLGSCAAAAGLLDCGSTHTHTHTHIYILSGSTSVVLVYRA
jgi:hypothetical protein